MPRLFTICGFCGAKRGRHPPCGHWMWVIEMVWSEWFVAERGGFEPPIPLQVCLISSQVHSTGLCHLSVFEARALPALSSLLAISCHGNARHPPQGAACPGGVQPHSLCV